MAADPLTCVLAAAGWNPRMLVASINQWLTAHGQSQRRLHRTSGYAWIRRGSTPLLPIPAVAAAVLSERLGTLIQPYDLWPTVGDTVVVISATDRAGSYRVDDMVTALLRLCDPAHCHSHQLVVASSPQELQAALLHSSVLPASAAARTATGRLDGVLAHHREALRRGVGTALCDDPLLGAYLTGQLRTILTLLRTRRLARAALLSAAADFACWCGRLELAASRTGAGQRYLVLSYRLAQAAGDAVAATEARTALFPATASSAADHAGAVTATAVRSGQQPRAGVGAGHLQRHPSRAETVWPGVEAGGTAEPMGQRAC